MVLNVKCRFWKLRFIGKLSIYVSPPFVDISAVGETDSIVSGSITCRDDPVAVPSVVDHENRLRLSLERDKVALFNSGALEKEVRSLTKNHNFSGRHRAWWSLSLFSLLVHHATQTLPSCRSWTETIIRAKSDAGGKQSMSRLWSAQSPFEFTH